MNRKIKAINKGFETRDGAGVHLTRVLSRRTIDDHDPFIMLDSFDTTDPSDYINGFPEHPHRGIETISYIYSGGMVHGDSLGNVDEVTSGGVQWMTAGSGILHSETIPATERMLGVQLWLNLSKANKFVTPEYHHISKEEIEEIKFDGGYLRLLAGKYKDHTGFMSHYQPLDYYDVHLEPGKSFQVDVDENKSITLFTLIGEIEVEGQKVEEKTGVALDKGDEVSFKNIGDEESYTLFLSSDAINEKVAWGGPVVMNSMPEVYEAFRELREGTFIKEKIEFNK
ncbi:pirin family protein [Lagierella sp.]|uniref:pirin family protein n=1 Tax=Lagierella sp. TaxID=2849657 RepID=UPI0026366CA4|nr:pirin family protein [Lagierella sp.]